MIHHIALTVNYTSELEAFYENVLMFNVHHRFLLAAEWSDSIFNMKGETEVVVMRHQDMEFELFMNQESEKKTFAHVCLTYWKSELIYANAQRAGYRAIIKPRQGHDTYFVWDKSGNLFEIKELEDYEEPV
jgi:catechol 2,3-dioxygenase-like lactoylglutathione lyase family enzyme